MNLDALQNLLTAANSTVDPLSRNQLIPTKQQDRLKWYANGGLASTIVDFWPNLVGSNIVLEINDSLNKSKTKQATDLVNYLNYRYTEINLLDTLIKLYTQVHLLPRGFGLISIENNVVTSTDLIVNANYKKLDDGKSEINQTVIVDDLLLIYNGKPNYKDHEPLPLIDPDTIKAAMMYEQAVNAVATLIQQKNRISMGIEDFNKNILNDIDGTYSKGMTSLLKTMQSIGNLLNVDIHDKNETEIKVIERSLQNVDNVLDRVRDYLLATTNNIPETRLFGRARTGGLGKMNDDGTKTNMEANRIFNRSWVGLIKKVNNVLFNEPDCPVYVDVYRHITIKREDLILTETEANIEDVRDIE